MIIVERMINMKRAAIIFTSGKVSKISFDKVTCVRVNKNSEQGADNPKLKLSIFYEKSGNFDLFNAKDDEDKTVFVDTLAALMLTNNSDQYVKFTDTNSKTVVLVPLNISTISAIEFSDQ